MRTARWVAAVAATVATAGLSPAGAAGAAPSTGPAVTRAGLAPGLVAGRGATVDILEQEAEHAATDGTIIGPGRDAYTLAAEASGRSAVQLAPGQHVEFTLPRAANAIAVRYSIPDSPTRRRPHCSAGRHGERPRPADDDAHLAVRLGVQPVPVQQ